MNQSQQIIERIAGLVEPKLKWSEIGHKKGDFLWAWDREAGEIFTADAGDGEHDDLFDSDVFHQWRGRFDVKTKIGSILPPESGPGGLRVPTKLKSELKKSFPKATVWKGFMGAKV